MKLSREMQKLMHFMHKDRTKYHKPSTTGFGLRTFQSLEKKGLVKGDSFGASSRSFILTDEGIDALRSVPRYD